MYKALNLKQTLYIFRDTKNISSNGAGLGGTLQSLEYYHVIVIGAVISLINVATRHFRATSCFENERQQALPALYP